MRDLYFSNPTEYKQMLSSDSATARLWQQVIIQSINDIYLKFSNVSTATIVQMNMDGAIIFSNSNISFGDTKNEIKNIPGKVCKFGNKEILVAEGKNKAATIWKIDYINISKVLGSTSEADQEFLQSIFGNIDIGSYDILWQYESNRYITSFQVAQNLNNIVISDGMIQNSPLFIRQGETVKWTNNSSIPVRIYSGFTDYNSFYANSDLSMFGSDFQSPILQSGEEWSKTFGSITTEYWFVYPTILTGKIIITEKEVNYNDQFIILENDGLNVPFSSRLIIVDYNGNVKKSFGESYLTSPKDAKSLTNGILIST